MEIPHRVLTRRFKTKTVFWPQILEPRYHGNVSDSAYGNAVGAAALMSAFELAPLVDATPNATFKHIAENLVIPFNKSGDFHPEFKESEWDARVGPLIKQVGLCRLVH